MNAKEAFKIMQGVEELRGALPEDGLLVEEALLMAIDALKKQIPMEPVKSKTPRYGMGYVYHDWECPSCGGFIAFETDINGLQKKHHCNKCGQALKKEEE